MSLFTKQHMEAILLSYLRVKTKLVKSEQQRSPVNTQRKDME